MQQWHEEVKAAGQHRNSLAFDCVAMIKEATMNYSFFCFWGLERSSKSSHIDPQDLNVTENNKHMQMHG